MTPEDTAFVLTSASSRGGVASAGLFRCSVRILVEKKFAHFAGHIAGDRSLLRPCKCLIQIGACQNSKTAHVLLSLGVRSVCDSAVGCFRTVFALAAGEMRQANFLAPAAINSRLSAWISCTAKAITMHKPITKLANRKATAAAVICVLLQIRLRPWRVLPGIIAACVRLYVTGGPLFSILKSAVAAL
jgi:hypothetical protein